MRSLKFWLVMVILVLGCKNIDASISQNELLGTWKSDSGKLIIFYPENVGNWSDVYFQWKVISSNNRSYMLIDNGSSINSYVINKQGEVIDLVGDKFYQYNPKIEQPIDGSSVKFTLNSY